MVRTRVRLPPNEGHHPGLRVQIGTEAGTGLGPVLGFTWVIGEEAFQGSHWDVSREVGTWWDPAPVACIWSETFISRVVGACGVWGCEVGSDGDGGTMGRLLLPFPKFTHLSSCVRPTPGPCVHPTPGPVRCYLDISLNFRVIRRPLLCGVCVLPSARDSED